MSHLFFDDLRADINAGDSVFTVDLLALNSTGISGTVTMIRKGDMLTVAVAAAGLTPGAHLGHIHGTFDGMGNPTDAVSPTILADTDGDGFVELAEGAPAYGPIILPFVDAMGNDPTADADGNLLFYATYDLTDPDTFNGDFDADDLGDLNLREVVIHGAVVPDGSGAGTGGEIDGNTDGFVAILPAAVGEIEQTTPDAALDILEVSRREFGLQIVGTPDDDQLFGSSADDVISGLEGNDSITAGGGDDTVRSGAGDDTVRAGADDDLVFGDEGNDKLYGESGDDKLVGMSGDDQLYGQSGDDSLFGGDGNDKLNGSLGNDLMRGGSGNDLFVYFLGDGDDSIAGFDVNEDTLDLRRVDMDDVQFSTRFAGTLITFDGESGSIFVAGVAPALVEDSIFG